VYSCRHDFALRAAQLYGLSPRVTAALMGHSLQTHVNHYGHWSDADTLDDAVAAAIQRTQALHARAMA
jgi:integrase